MTETQTERETEIVAGTIGGITQKKADTWTVAVTPEGSEYSKNLWTKDTELVESLAAKIGQAGAFVCNASYWERDGKQIRSLWISSETDSSEPSTPAASSQVAAETLQMVAKAATKAQDVMSKEEWARKDSAIHKMACIKTAADALKHTIPSDPTPEDLGKFIARCVTLTQAWHRSVIAERDDPAGEDVPF